MVDDLQCLSCPARFPGGWRHVNAARHRKATGHVTGVAHPLAFQPMTVMFGGIAGERIEAGDLLSVRATDGKMVVWRPGAALVGKAYTRARTEDRFASGGEVP